MAALSSQYWRRGYFYSFAQQNKHRYQTFSEVLDDLTIIDKFNEFIKEQEDDIQLPGEKELGQVKEKIAALDSMNTEANQALETYLSFTQTRKKKVLHQSRKIFDR